MTSPKHQPPRGPEPLTLTALSAEIMRARLKFPDRAHLLATLIEQVVVLAEAFMHGKPKDEIEREALQVACVATRIVEEGDSAFNVRASRPGVEP